MHNPDLDTALRRAGTAQQSWYSAAELVQRSRAGTAQQSWYSAAELVQRSRAGTAQQCITGIPGLGEARKCQFQIAGGDFPS